MTKNFQRSLMLLGAMFFSVTVLFFLGVMAAPGSALEQTLLNIFTMIMCVSPLVMIYTVITGIQSIWRMRDTVLTKQKRYEKRKRHAHDAIFTDNDFDDQVFDEALYDDESYDQITDKRSNSSF